MGSWTWSSQIHINTLPAAGSPKMICSKDSNLLVYWITTSRKAWWTPGLHSWYTDPMKGRENRFHIVIALEGSLQLHCHKRLLLCVMATLQKLRTDPLRQWYGSFWLHHAFLVPWSFLNSVGCQWKDRALILPMTCLDICRPMKIPLWNIFFNSL